MRPLVLLLLASVAATCANGGSTGDTNVLTAAPRTFELVLAAEARGALEQRLARGDLDVARLAIHDLRPRSADALKGVRIFIELPAADAATRVDDPHYAGSFVLGLGSRQSVLVNIGPTLARLRRAGELGDLAQTAALRVTLVPEPWEFARAMPDDFAISFGALTLEVPR
jgi:hypothetical protein